MLRQMRFVFILLAVMTVTVQARLPQAGTAPVAKLPGRWRVKFIVSGAGQKNLIFDAKVNRSSSFRLLDTGPDGKPVAEPLSAVWSELTNRRVSFAGQVELPLGTCCREIGTVIFNGKFDSDNSISGKLVFVTNIDEEESPYKFRTEMGTFTAVRMLED